MSWLLLSVQTVYFYYLTSRGVKSASQRVCHIPDARHVESWDIARVIPSDLSVSSNVPI